MSRDTTHCQPRPSEIIRPYSNHLRRQERTEARYGNLTIRSAFQPIFSFAHSRPVGFEGLARASDPQGRSISPVALLSQERTIEDSVFLDRLLRALHVANFTTYPFDNSWLFLNVHPKVVIQGKAFGPFFRELLQVWSIPPQRVVIEVTEDEISDEGVLEEATAYYKDMGCLVAIDDFGVGHSNFHRIWRLRPDIVKLDRLMVNRAARDPAARRGLVGIAGLLHEIGALVLAEGIETEEEALAALHAEIDLLQGYFVQKPFVGPAPSMNLQERFDGLRRSLLRQAKEEESEFSTLLRSYVESFGRAADRLASGQSFPGAVEPLLGLKHMVRCYLLNADGSQVGDSLLAPDYVSRLDRRREPLADVQGTNWMHRHYFRRALANPAAVQVSRPYLSLTDPRMCLTLSRAVPLDGILVVVCCDLEYSPGGAR